MNVAQKLQEALQTLAPSHISLENESYHHAGYFEGKQSHFKLVIVSDDFLGKRPLARHQMVYQQVGSLLTSQGGSVHALAIHAYTPDEWRTRQTAPKSPNCAGQNKG